eukprot:990626-Prorocentrum_minimum.AAC.2
MLHGRHICPRRLEGVCRGFRKGSGEGGQKGFRRGVRREIAQRGFGGGPEGVRRGCGEGAHRRPRRLIGVARRRLLYKPVAARRLPGRLTPHHHAPAHAPHPVAGLGAVARVASGRRGAEVGHGQGGIVPHAPPHATPHV